MLATGARHYTGASVNSGPALVFWPVKRWHYLLGYISIDATLPRHYRDIDDEALSFASNLSQHAVVTALVTAFSQSSLFHSSLSSQPKEWMVHGFLSRRSQLMVISQQFINKINHLITD